MPDPIEYDDNGNVVEYDDQGNRVSLSTQPDIKPPSLASQAFSWANKPLLEFPQRWANELTSLPDNSRQLVPDALKPIYDFQQQASRGAVNTAGGLISGLTSPLNIGLTAATMGANNYASPVLGYIAKGLSGIVGGKGAYNVYAGDTLADKLLGAAQMGMGYLGMRAKYTPELPPKPTVAMGGRSNTGLYGERTTTPSKFDYPSSPISQAPNKTFVAGPPSKFDSGNVLVKTPGMSEGEANVVMDELGRPNPGINPITKKFRKQDRPTYSGTGQPDYAATSARYDAQVKAGQAAKAKMEAKAAAIDQALKVNPDAVTPEQTAFRKLYELTRAAEATGDLSAPFRQGYGMIGTENWFKAWRPMFQSMKSEEAYKLVTAKWEALPHVKSGLADEAGLSLTKLSKNLDAREESLRSTLVEKIPLLGRYFKATNRAFHAFLNDLRANTFNGLVDDAIKIGIDPNDIQYMKKLAEFVNDATGRGKIAFGVNTLEGGSVNIMGHRVPKEINFENRIKTLTDVFFAPRLMASRARMLNPGTYIMLPPQIRQQYLWSLVRMGTAYTAIATLGKLGGAKISSDPDSADFGKFRWGNTRIDAAAGHQQYLVLASRLATGKFTSSTTGQTRTLGSSFKARTAGDVVQDFVMNKTHPWINWAWDLAKASKYKPFGVADRTLQLFIPMVFGDLGVLAQKDPSLAAAAIPSYFGMGQQTYGKGQEKPTLVPPQYDVMYQGGGARGMGQAIQKAF